MKNFIIKLWCKLPHCWRYTEVKRNDTRTIVYIWLFGRKYDIFSFNGDY